MDILLIKPSFARVYRKVLASLHEHIGLEYIAAKLISDGISVGILDFEVTQITPSQFEGYLKKHCPQIVGITVPTASLVDVKKTVHIVRKVLKNVKIIVGGPHTTALPKETLSYTKADIAVIGEGEETMSELAAALFSDGDISKIDGICYKTPIGGYSRHSVRKRVWNLDSLPFPARDLVSRGSYRYYVPIPVLDDKPVFASMLTSRGCPFSCIFCSSRVTFGSKARERSVENICDEIEILIKQFGVNLIYFNDDTFTYNQNRIHALCDEIIKRRFSFSWLAETRVDCVSPELLRHMSAAGCKVLTFGIEAGHPKILKKIKKDISLPKIRAAFQWTKKAKIRTQANFMLGHPGETKEEMQATVKLAKEINPFIAGFYTVLPLPGTILHKMAEGGSVLDEKFYSNLMFFDKSQMSLSKLSPEELLNEQRKAYRSFYFRPYHIFLKLFCLRSIDEWIKMWNGFKSVIRITH